MALPSGAVHPRLSDRPAPSSSEIQFGSDAIAEQLSRLGMPWFALVPGSSYRGLHDSLVNLKGNAGPEMLICLHEEHAVALAHGYAKVLGKPMAVGLHANVGLMHATMAIYNAWCDRVPMLIIGATGPLDAARRRPWIDWLHTATDQAALIRPFIKFDDQPHSPNAAMASLVHATAMTSAKPCGPAYVCLDVSLQEDEVDPKTLHYLDTARYLQVVPPGPSKEDTIALTALLRTSKKPLFLLGRMKASQEFWTERVRLAEHYGAKIVTDIKQACSFPSAHPLFAAPPATFISPQVSELIRSADVIVSFDWVDLAGALKASLPEGTEPSSTIVLASLDSALHNGWSKDHFGHPPVDLMIKADPDKVVSALVEHLDGMRPNQTEWQPRPAAPIPDIPNTKDIYTFHLAEALYAALPPDDICLVRAPLAWDGADLQITHPLGFMGMDGGAGIGSGPGQVVGTALALKEINSPLMAVAILGDGDYAMGGTALWTAARYRLPLLVIVANNASYYNDEIHQERVANRRGRPVENKWIGMRLDDPAVDVHKFAQGLGLNTVTDLQVKERSELPALVKKAVAEVKKGKAVVLDVHVLPGGYSKTVAELKK